MAEIEYLSVSISKLLEDDKKFSLVLPHFQRKFVWKPKDQKSLLLSLLAGVPVGYILLLTGEKDAYYNRPLCFDLKPNIKTHTVQYLLDGQQRISTMKSMFTDLLSEEERKRFGVKSIKDLEKKLPPSLKRRWFLQINGNAEDVFGLNELPEKLGGARFTHTPQDFDDYVVDEKMAAEYASTDNGATNLHEIHRSSWKEKRLPLWMLHDLPLLRKILKNIAEEHHEIEKLQDQEGEDLKSKIERWADAVVDFLHEKLLRASMGRLVVPSGSGGMSIGISIFEQVNRGGMQLDVYDLLVARAADDKFNLTEKIRDVVAKSHPVMHGMRSAEKKWNPKSIEIWDEKHSTLSPRFRTLFRNCLPICVLDADPDRTLLDIKNDDIKEKSLLALTRPQITENWESTVNHILHVLQFLHLRCGLVKIAEIPYDLLVVPLFVCFINQSKQKEGYTSAFIDNLEFWWWASIFSGHYQDKHGPKVIEDSKHFLKNENFCERMKKVFDKEGYSDQTTLIQQQSGKRSTRLNLALKQYVLSKEPYDLKGKKQREKITAFKIANGGVKVHDHHVIPIDEMADNGAGDLRKEISNPVNGPLNKTLVSEKANYKIKKISDYRRAGNQLDCDSNLMPVPNDKKYLNKDPAGPYLLEKFLGRRFEMIKADVVKRLTKLSAK
ncbi:MAG: DUF262 domain-containing protein [Gammaproteobacteria bacterium]|nr:DUF262 domain-containing protein [Gammaproteobacteria bacterium]MDA7971324.1 DUF262 domain-containing protein [Gammaproteobacteria bacterium]CAJ2376996.1 MAG: conserved hypothetical protein [Arenicellales bacterium IbO2]